MKVDRRLSSIWDCLKHTNRYHDASCDYVRELAEKKKLIVFDVSEEYFQIGDSFHAIKLSTDKGIAIYPRVPKESVDDIEDWDIVQFWKEADWFIPPYVSWGEIYDSVRLMNQNRMDSTSSSTSDLQKDMDIVIINLYDNPYKLSVITNQVLIRAHTVAEYLPIIREAIIAFYSGFRAVAIAAIIPIVEKILRTFLELQDEKLSPVDVIDKIIEKSKEKIKRYEIGEVDWLPEEYLRSNRITNYSERYMMIILFESWLKNSFYKDTKVYSNYSGFNRHMFAHAKSQDWQKPSNFFRAMGLLQMLSFLECMTLENTQASIFYPVANEESIAFAEKILNAEMNS